MFVQQFVKYFALIKFSAIKARYWQPNYKILHDWNRFRVLWWLLFRVYLLVYVFSICWVVSGVVHSLVKISNQSVLLLYFAFALRYILHTLLSIIFSRTFQLSKKQCKFVSHNIKILQLFHWLVGIFIKLVFKPEQEKEDQIQIQIRNGFVKAHHAGQVRRQLSIIALNKIVKNIQVSLRCFP